MKDVTGLSDGEFHHDLLELVHREFGRDGLERFFHNYGDKYGDYTRDRHIWLDGVTMEQIVEDLKSMNQTKAA